MARVAIKRFVRASPISKSASEKIEDVVIESQPNEFEAMIRTAKGATRKNHRPGRTLSPDILLVLDDVADPGVSRT